MQTSPRAVHVLTQRGDNQQAGPLTLTDPTGRSPHPHSPRRWYLLLTGCRTGVSECRELTDTQCLQFTISSLHVPLYNAHSPH
ncbi:hypothetical protein FKM82_025327 [Ascaphus truei]